MTVPTTTSFFIPRLCVVTAKDVEVVSLFQPYRCRVTDLLGAHRGQVAGAVIEAKLFHLPHVRACNLIALGDTGYWIRAYSRVD